MTTHEVPLDAVPRHAAGVTLRQGRRGDRLVDGEGRTVHVLNATALALWEVCDGETSVREMSEAVVALFDVPSDVARADVRETLGALADARLLVWQRTRDVPS